MTILRMNVVILHPTLPDPGINTWHLRVDNPTPVSGDTIGLVAAIGEFYASLITDVLAQGGSWTFNGDMTSEEAEPRMFSDMGDFTAGNQGSSLTLPPANCIVAGWGTTSATRRGKGRTFLGPLQQATNGADGTPTDTALNAVRNAQDALLADVAAVGNGGIGVYSRVDHVLRDYVSRTVHNKFAVLRSRRD